MSSWDAVGGNPCPGDVGEIRARATALSAVAENGKALEARLKDLHSGMGDLRWSGAGAEAMTTTIQENVPGLAKMWSSHADAARSLSTYVDRLDSLQQKARVARDDYHQAVADRNAAGAEHDDAAGRYSTARNRSIQLQAELKGYQARRLAAVAAQQSTAWLDSKIQQLGEDIRYQAGLASKADSQKRAAEGRRSAADSRAKAARGKINAFREENEGHAATASKAILAAVGIVRSNNPFVRAWDQVVDGAKTAADWFDEYGLDILDDVIMALSLIALVAGPAAPVIAAAALVMSAVSLAGHLYRNLNGNERNVDTAWAVVGALPFGRVLGKLSKTRGMSARAAGARFEGNLPGLVKRSVWPEASRATGIFSKKGGLKVGKSVYRVHSVPKQTTGPAWLYDSMMSGQMLKEGRQIYDVAEFGYRGGEALGELTTQDADVVVGAPVATVQLPTQDAA